MSLIATLSLFATLSANAPVVAIHVVGEVEMQSSAGSQPLARFGEVPEGATVVTHTGGLATLRFATGSLLRLGSDTKITIQTAQRSEPVARSNTRVKLTLGRMWVKLTSLFGRDSTFDVATDNAVAGVRGTAFWVESGAQGDEWVIDFGGIDLMRDNTTLRLAGQGSAVRIGSAGMASPHQLNAAQLATLRRNVGGVGARLVDRLQRAGVRPAEQAELRDGLRQGTVGPDGLGDVPLAPPGRSDEVHGKADLTVKLRLR